MNSDFTKALEREDFEEQGEGRQDWILPPPIRTV